jgi:hypothetical protein
MGTKANRARAVGLNHVYEKYSPQRQRAIDTLDNNSVL